MLVAITTSATGIDGGMFVFTKVAGTVHEGQPPQFLSPQSSYQRSELARPSMTAEAIISPKITCLPQ